MRDPTVSMRELMEDATVEVSITGYKSWLWRLKLGLLFIKIGGWVTGMSFEIDEEVHESD